MPHNEYERDYQKNSAFRKYCPSVVQDREAGSDALDTNKSLPLNNRHNRNFRFSKSSSDKPVHQTVNSSIQNRFLGIALKNSYPVTVATYKGEITGTILAFDTYTIALKTRVGIIHLIQKHACHHFICEGITADDLVRRPKNELEDKSLKDSSLTPKDSK